MDLMKSVFGEAQYRTLSEQRESSFFPNLKDSCNSTGVHPLFLSRVVSISTQSPFKSHNQNLFYSVDY